MKLTAVLIDDELGALETLNRMLNLYIPIVEVKGKARNVEKGIELIHSQVPDIVFLDMDLNGSHGFKVLEYFDVLPFEVIIISAHADFALESYKFRVVDYLLKPISPGNLKKAVDRVMETVILKRDPEKVIPSIINMEIKLSFPQGSKNVNAQFIVRMEASRNYSQIFFHNEPPITVSKNLSLLEEMVLPFGFIRIHHSHIVNPAFIRTFHKHTNQIEMKDGISLSVSREKKAGVLSALAGM